MKTKLTLILGLIFSLLLAGCAGQPSPTAPTEPPTEAPTVSTGGALNGTKWVLVTLNGQPVLADVQVTLILEEENLNGSDGCNSYGGTYQSSGSDFKVGSDLMSTMMACSDEIMQQAAAYTAALAETASYEFAENELSLLDASGSVLAVFSR